VSGVSMSLSMSFKARIGHSRSVHARAVAPPDYDLEVSGLKHLPPGAREIATQKKINPFEKIKNKKCGSAMWSEVHELSAALREGKHTFEELDLDDVNVRLKWAGLFHRKKRKPGTFMMRLKVRVLRCRDPQRLSTHSGSSAGLRVITMRLAPYRSD
jgi:hypothetical protein